MYDSEHRNVNENYIQLAQRIGNLVFETFCLRAIFCFSWKVKKLKSCIQNLTYGTYGIHLVFTKQKEKNKMKRLTEWIKIA